MDELAGLWGACHIISVIGSPTSRAIPRKISPAIVNRDRTTTRSVNWIRRVDRRVPIIPIIPCDAIVAPASAPPRMPRAIAAPGS